MSWGVGVSGVGCGGKSEGGGWLGAWERELCAQMCAAHAVFAHIVRRKLNAAHSMLSVRPLSLLMVSSKRTVQGALSTVSSKDANEGTGNM